jgi:LemA protein
MSVPIIVILAIAVFALLWTIAAYNGLIARRNQFKNAFAQIDVQLKRRYDLIPNLVETAKGYLAHERNTLEAVIAARNGADTARQAAAANPDNAQSVKNLSSAETALAGTLGRFFALSEAYPDLKSNQTMGQLMEELSSTENRVGFARQAFNDAVTAYNTARESFPSSVIAGSFHFEPAELLQVESPDERKAPKVSF